LKHPLILTNRKTISIVVERIAFPSEPLENACRGKLDYVGLRATLFVGYVYMEPGARIDPLDPCDDSVHADQSVGILAGRKWILPIELRSKADKKKEANCKDTKPEPHSASRKQSPAASDDYHAPIPNDVPVVVQPASRHSAVSHGSSDWGSFKAGVQMAADGSGGLRVWHENDPSHVKQSKRGRFCLQFSG
jgi:hypothetical protein